jgi:hypothetical protein
MCDYSLEVYGSRPAREGERYVTSRFPSGTIGLTSPEHASTAVCLNCDTALEIHGIPDAMCRELGIKPDEDAIFIRLDAGTYRDGIRFSNGADDAEVSARRGLCREAIARKHKDACRAAPCA